MVARTFRAALLPGLLTAGEQNRIVDYLQTRTALRGGSLWSAFVAADKHAAADRAHYLHGTQAEPLDVRVRALAGELSTTPIVAAFVLGHAGGLREGIAIGRSAVIRERAAAAVRRREREHPPEKFDPEQAKREIEDARGWQRTAGALARRTGKS